MNIKHYISAAVLALVGMGFTACDGKDEPDYKPADKPADSERVYFASSLVSKNIDPEATSFDVLIYRPENDDADELTVDLLASCTEEGVLSTTEYRSIITVPSSVTFAAGEPNASISIQYDATAMTPNHVYPVYISVASENANEYGLTEVRVNINKEEYTDWEPYDVDEALGRNGQGNYTFSIYYGGNEDPVQLLSRYVPSNPKDMQFQIQWLVDNEDPSKGWETFLTAETKDGMKTIQVPQQEFAMNDTYGMVYVADTYTYYGKEEYDGLSKFDNVSGLMTLNLIYYVPGVGSFGNGNEYLQLNGYADTNEYSLTITDNGQVNIADNDYSVINFQLSETLDFVDYTIVELPEDSNGLSEEEVADIASAIQRPEQTNYAVSTVTESGNVTLSFPSSGKFEIIAVGYHTGNDGSSEAKITETCVFSFETFDPYAGWTPVTDKAVYVDNLFAALYGNPEFKQELTVEVASNDEFEGVFRITNPYADSDLVEAVGASHASFGSIEFVVTEDGIVYFPYSKVGIIEDKMDWEICSYSYYMLDNDVEPANIPAQFWGSFNNGKVTLDAVNISNAASFLMFLGDDGYYADMDFYLDINGDAAAAPAKKHKATGTLTRNAVRLASAKPSSFPARFKASFEAAAKTQGRNLKLNASAPRRR